MLPPQGRCCSPATEARFEQADDLVVREHAPLIGVSQPIEQRFDEARAIGLLAKPRFKLGA
jgi:hypothetical protein